MQTGIKCLDLIASKYHELSMGAAARFEEGVVKDYNLAKPECITQRRKVVVNGKLIEIVLTSRLPPLNHTSE